MKYIMTNFIGLVLIAAAIGGVGFYATMTFAGLKEAEMKNEARFQCAMSSTYITTDPSGASVSYPVEELYTQCLSEKGVN